MFERAKRVHSWRASKIAAVAFASAVVLGGVLLVAPSTAFAKSSTNTFTFTGAYSGTLTLKSSQLDCSWGKSYNGKSYLVTLSHMKGTIAGAGTGTWTVTAYVKNQGTNTLTKANVQSLNDTSFQSNADPIIAFDMTSGTITYHGSKGSLDLKVEYHAIGSTTYGGTATVKGSWNCPNGLNMS